jgi:sugar phosphate isomerase/epimerase
MTSTRTPFTLFTKPWPGKSLPELAGFVRSLGFDGIELPVRPGFQVPPENVKRGLPDAVRVFADIGLKIGSIAAPTDEATMAACAEAHIPIIRIMAPIPAGANYLAAIEEYQHRWDELVPLAEKHGVAIGVQNHYGRFLANAMQLRHAIGKYHPKHICAIWDPAHNGLEGEQVDLAIDTVWSHLRIVNFKSAFWKLASTPEAGESQWEVSWTTGRRGRAHWRWTADELTKRGFQGDICFSAEYTDHAAVDKLIGEDITYAKSLFAQGGRG